MNKTHDLHRLAIILSLVPIFFLAGLGLSPKILNTQASNLVMSKDRLVRSTDRWQDRVDPWVLETAADGQTEFLVYLNEQANLSGATEIPTKQAKGEYVVHTLRQVANRTQAPLIAELNAQGVQYRSFWIANMIWVRAGQPLIQSLASRSDVAHIYGNPHVRLETPPVTLDSELPEGLSPSAIEWNIQHVNAPQVWQAGYTGQGVVIGGQDTGYNWTHPALKNQYRGWNGITAEHDYNWHDAIHEDNSNTAPGNPCGFDTKEPCDDHGHGTHTMGTMVGDDGAGNQVGMAPGARWIACRNMEQGWGSPASYSECYQWFIAPTDLNGENPRPDLAPDVINNSWSCPASEGCTEPEILRTVVQNVRAAGILTVHSAGNSGPGCNTVNTPAGMYPESFSAGATDNQDMIASFSSRGPAWIAGQNWLKPDIAAPGVSIRSSSLAGSYGTGSGTSMAAPHVAGLAALLISANPKLAGQVDTIEAVIEKSALPMKSDQDCGIMPGNSIPNNTYGWGRIDAWQAYQMRYLTLYKSVSVPHIYPGEALTYTISVHNNDPSDSVTNIVLTDSLPANTTFLDATTPFLLNGNSVRWDLSELGPQETASVELVISIPQYTFGEIINQYYQLSSDQLPDPVIGRAISTPIHQRHYLPVIRLNAR